MGANWRLLILVIFLLANVYAKFVIERDSSLQNIFTNPGGCYRPNSCKALSAKCYRSQNATYSHCCRCICEENKSTFLSLHTGCLDEKEILNKNRQCLFTFKSFENRSIPTFNSISQLNGVHGELSYHSPNNMVSLEPNNSRFWCFARRIYFFTRYGKEILAFENSCLEIMNIKLSNTSDGTVNYYLKFNSNESDWEVLNGKLVKVEIICRNVTANSTVLSSCLIFQVNGSYNDQESFASHHSPTLCPPAPPYIPEPTTQRPPIPTVSLHRAMRIAIAASVASAFAFIAIMVLVWVFVMKYLKSKDRKATEQANSTAIEPFLDQRNENHEETCQHGDDPTLECEGRDAKTEEEDEERQRQQEIEEEERVDSNEAKATLISKSDIPDSAVMA